MLHMMIERDERIDKVLFFDGGWEFPEMLRHIDLVEKKTGFEITRVYPIRGDFDYWMFDHSIVASKGPKKGQVHRIGNGWSSPMRRWCTRLKVEALNRATPKDSVECVGFAADEKERTQSKNVQGRNVRFPLIEYGVTEEEAHAYCRVLGYTWEGLYDDFKRVSCFCCPLQRLSELRTLRRKRPELWNRMLEMDSRVPEHNRGFHHYDTVHDLEKRFVNEDLQGELFPMEEYEKKEEDWFEKCGLACTRF